MRTVRPAQVLPEMLVGLSRPDPRATKHPWYTDMDECARLPAPSSCEGRSCVEGWALRSFELRSLDIETSVLHRHGGVGAPAPEEEGNNCLEE